MVMMMMIMVMMMMIMVMMMMIMVMMMRLLRAASSSTEQRKRGLLCAFSTTLCKLFTPYGFSSQIPLGSIYLSSSHD